MPHYAALPSPVANMRSCYPSYVASGGWHTCNQEPGVLWELGETGCDEQHPSVTEGWHFMGMPASCTYYTSCLLPQGSNDCRCQWPPAFCCKFHCWWVSIAVRQWALERNAPHSLWGADEKSLPEVMLWIWRGCNITFDRLRWRWVVPILLEVNTEDLILVETVLNPLNIAWLKDVQELSRKEGHSRLRTLGKYWLLRHLCLLFCWFFLHVFLMLCGQWMTIFDMLGNTYFSNQSFLST